MKQNMDKLAEDKSKEIEKLKQERDSEMELLRRQLSDVIGEKAKQQEQSQKDMERLTEEIRR